jgi:pimeloyl-ACP methyl ester carboxylesterase
MGPGLHERPMTLVLLPGFMTDPDLWADMLPSLAPLGPILHGDLSRDATIDAMARRVAAEAPDRFTLIGFSMGGYVAREITRLAPERVRALVLIATSPRADTPGQARRKTAAVDNVRRRGSSARSIPRGPATRPSSHASAGWATGSAATCSCARPARRA